MEKLMRTLPADLAAIVLDEANDLRMRVNAAEALHAKLPNLNGANWLMLTPLAARQIKDAMLFDTSAFCFTYGR